MKRPKVRMVWMGGTSEVAGVAFFDVDPPLAPGEVEIDTSDLEAAPVRMSPAELAAFEDMTRER